MGGIKSEVNKMIGRKLKELREGKGLTQEQLGAALGTDPHYLSSLENGKRGVGPDMRKRYCDYFGITEEELSNYLPTKNKGGKLPPIAQMILDEILAMPLPDQTRLLAEIQERKEHLQSRKDGEKQS